MAPSLIFLHEHYAKITLTLGNEASWSWGTSQLDLHLTGIDHNVVAGAQIASANNSWCIVPSH